jgi:transposase
MAPVLDEQSRRRFAALEAQALGRGGVSLIARITGLARSTIYRGLADIRNKYSAEPGRVRKAGAGRKKKVSQDLTLLGDLKRLVEPTTRCDPTGALLWTSRSVRKLTKELNKMGHSVSHTIVGKLRRELNHSLQANSKTLEGTDNIDRDAQFDYINKQAKSFLTAKQLVISVDANRKEIIGNFKNNGREWRPKNNPESVKVHDFIDPKLKRAVPYGVYDINNNVGCVSVGTDHNTASFAVNTIRRCGGERWERNGGFSTQAPR